MYGKKNIKKYTYKVPCIYLKKTQFSNKIRHLFKNNNNNSLSSERCFGLKNRAKAIITSPKIKYLLSNFSHFAATAVLLRKI
jgi:hypothetical protein